MATRKQLLDQNDNEILPITDTESVRNPQNIGGTLESRLQNIKENIDANNLLVEQSSLTNEQRIQAFANISNQEAGYDESDPLVFTGKMGYVVLQPQTDDKTTFASQIANKPNTIFEIRDVYNLDGTVTIPANCTLKFNGGKLKNGTLQGNSTVLQPQNGSFDNITFSGSFVNKEFYIRWTTIPRYDENDEVDTADSLSNIFEKFQVVILSYMYGIGKPIHIPVSAEICGETSFAVRHGLKAITGFESITVAKTINNVEKTATTKSLLYSSEWNNAVIRDILLDANKKADCGIEHLDFLQYNNLWLNNIKVENALKCGILQYGCENMTWQNVNVSYCNIGAYIGTKKVNYSDILSNSETQVGLSNIVKLTKCSFTFCNYGIVFNNNSNCVVNELKTNNNYLFAIGLVYTYVELNGYYTETDALANGYIDNEGNIVSGNNSVPQYLRDNDLDGYKNNMPYPYTSLDSYYGVDVYYRAPIICIASTLCGIGNYISLMSRTNPSDRTSTGVDSIVIAKSTSKITFDYKTYFKNSVDPKAYYIVLRDDNNFSESSLPTIRFSSDINYDNAIYYSFLDANNIYYIVKTGFNDKKLDVITRLSQHSYNVTAKSYKFSYNGVKLYDIESSTSVIFTKEEFDNIFNGKQIKLSFYTYNDVASVKSYIGIQIRFRENGNNVRAISQLGTTNTNPSIGLHKHVLVIDTSIVENYDDVVLAINTNKGSTATNRAYVSDMMFYPINEYECEVLPSVSTLNTHGSENERPIACRTNLFTPNCATPSDVGFVYFDETLGKSIVLSNVTVGTSAQNNTGSVTWLNLDGSPLTTFTIDKSGIDSNIDIDNALQSIDINKTYVATLTPKTGFSISSVQVTVGGVDVTSFVYNLSTGVIYIAGVTGNIAITATATQNT